MEAKHYKYVDDMTLVEALKLKEKLKTKPEEDWVRHVPYHSRFEQIWENQESQESQEKLTKLKEYTEVDNMKINKKKTKIMLFNTADKNDFMPDLNVDDRELFEGVEEIKLLRVIITSDLN